LIENATKAESLAEAARQATREKKPGVAVEIWRQVSVMAPEAWANHLGLALALAQDKQFVEADATFTNAISLFPDAIWLRIHRILTLRASSHADHGLREAYALRSAFPDHWRSRQVLGDMLFDAGLFEDAAIELAAAEERCPGDQAEVSNRRRLADFYAKLATRWRAGEQKPDYFAAVISLNHGAVRSTLSRERLQSSPVPVLPIQGVYGRHLPKAAVERLASALIPAPNWQSTLGCTLGHIAALEALCLSTYSHALILEDDAAPIVSLPAKVEGFGVPPDCELCFINNRFTSCFEDDLDIADWPLVVGLEAIISKWPRKFSAPGADAYLITKRAATKLLEWFKADGYGGFFDWRLVTYGVSKPFCNALGPDTTPGAMLGKLASATRNLEHLQSYAIYPPIVRNVASFSVIAQENRLGNQS
jgi:GR25 family glycosyltransferase involved in LPS biosynthesis